MNSYLFFIGQNSALSQAELSNVLPSATLQELTSGIIRLSIDAKLDIPELGCRLGGTIKIAEKVTHSSKSKLKDDLIEILKDKKAKNFSINHIDATNKESTVLADKVKNALIELELHPRYIWSRSTGISPIIVTKQKAVELTIDDQFDIYHTTWVHNFKHWISRDRKKPYITPKDGMLPPKLARMMVNLGIADRDPSKTTLLDPFCGTGTVLMEAKLLGAKVIGSDLSEEKVRGTFTNMDWLSDDQACTKTQKHAIYTANATAISSMLGDQQVDVIVTEPTLGPPSPREDRVRDIAHGLQKLYLGSLKHWATFLKPGGRVVITLPVFHGKNRSYKTSSFIDGRENLGYNILRSDLIFTRPGARIEREIIILEKK